MKGSKIWPRCALSNPQRVQQLKGLGPFGAELAVVPGTNAPDTLPRHERRLDAEIVERYGSGHTLAEVSEA